MIIFSVGESGKAIVNFEGKSGKTISIGCCFPPKFVDSGTLHPPVFERAEEQIEVLDALVGQVVDLLHHVRGHVLAALVPVSLQLWDRDAGVVR